MITPDGPISRGVQEWDPNGLGERNGSRDWRKRREQNATIVVRSEVPLKRSEPFLARRRSYRHSRRRRNRAAPWQQAEPAVADQIPVAKGRQSRVQLHQELSNSWTVELSLTRAANPTASAFFYRVVRGRWVVAPPP